MSGYAGRLRGPLRDVVPVDSGAEQGPVPEHLRPPPPARRPPSEPLTTAEREALRNRPLPKGLGLGYFKRPGALRRAVQPAQDLKIPRPRKQPSAVSRAPVIDRPSCPTGCGGKVKTRGMRGVHRRWHCECGRNWTV